MIRSQLSESRPTGPAALLALIRLIALGVVLAGERLMPHPQGSDDLFAAVFVVAMIYAATAAWRARRSPGDEGVPNWQLVLDVVLLCALAYTSGGPFSEARYGFFVVPVAAALLARPRTTAAASGIAVLGYIAVSLLHPANQQSEAVAFEAAQVAYLLLTGLAATLVSTTLARRAAQVETLAASRGRLVAQTLDAEDHYRRELAEALHDEALQNLLAARQELANHRSQDADLTMVRVGLERTVAQLRGAVFDLHPYLLEHAGLGPALEAVAEDGARWGGFDPVVSVEPCLTDHQQLLFSVGRELIRNVARHAGADHLWATVRRDEGAVVLLVADDGRGFDHDRLPVAPLSGHIGLAAMAERVEAVGGSFSIGGGPGSGTRVEVRLPAEPTGAPRLHGDPGPRRIATPHGRIS